MSAEPNLRDFRELWGAYEAAGNKARVPGIAGDPRKAPLAAARPAKGGEADKFPRAALIVSRSEPIVASTADGS